MKSVFLEGISGAYAAQAALDVVFPDQPNPTKVVIDRRVRSPVGWLYVSKPDATNEQLGPFLIQGDYSGRDLGIDTKAVVIEALRRVQEHSGGKLRDYGD
jgi:hypothetical protein